MQRLGPGEPPGPIKLPPPWPEWSLEERILRFTRMMVSFQGEVHRMTVDSLPEKVGEIAREKGLANLLFAPETSWGRQLTGAASELPHLIPYDRTLEELKKEMFWEVDAALTGTWGAAAVTGSLVLIPDMDEPRSMSLVPPVHIAVLQAERIFADMSQVFVEGKWSSEGLPTNLVMISGPSKTADIEQTLAFGVHGPKELVVLIVE